MPASNQNHHGDHSHFLPGVSLHGPLDALDTPVCFEDKTYFARQEFCGMKKRKREVAKKKQQKEMAEFYTKGRSSVCERL